MINKTIFIFRQYAYPPTVPGGTRHFNLSKELVNRGYKVYIFSSTFHHDMKKNIKELKNYLWKIENVDGVNFVWIHTIAYKKNNWRRYLNALDYSLKTVLVSQQLMKKKIKPDIVIGSVAHSFALISAYIVSKYSKSKYFVDIGDLWPDALVDAGSLKKDSILYTFIDKISNFAYKKAEKIFCVTEAMKNNLLLKGFNKNKVLVTPPGIVFNNLQFNEANLNKNEKGDFLIIYAGSFNLLYPVENILYSAEILKKRDF